MYIQNMIENNEGFHTSAARGFTENDSSSHTERNPELTPSSKLSMASQLVEAAAYEFAGDWDRGFVARLMLLSNELENCSHRTGCA